jgi:hypothetical protein
MCLTLSVAPLHVRQTGRTLENANSAHRRQEDPSCRRAFGIQVARSIGFLCSGSLIATPSKVLAASQIESDKSKLYEGYEKLTYFLDNWVKETTVCGRSGDNPYISKGGCERTPEKVMDYLGYKSMNHPLFRADVTMRRLESLVPEDRESEYLEAIEKWMEAADAGNGLAFVSSWGEANPGGGKDRVELFLDRSKKSVVEARDSLATILNILQITKPT